MKVTGIIAEFNPLHNGHAYFLKEARRLTDADYVVVVLSSDLTQRGAPAICDKYTRSLMTLKSGADAVIELPAGVSSSSAEFFASSGVFLLNATGVVTDMVFGTEYADIGCLIEIADTLVNETDEYRSHLKENLKNGLSYPTARTRALLEALPGIHDLNRIMSFPNDILAVEYLKALKRTGSSITPHLIRRLGAGYHDNRISQVNASALAIRSAIKELDSVDSLRSEIPEPTFKLLQDGFMKTLPVYTNDLSQLLRYRLISEVSQKNDLTQYAGVSKSLNDRIIKKLPQYEDFEGFISLLKTKDMTYTRISRALMHILLDFHAPEEALSEENSYIAFLGYKESAYPLIKEIKNHSSIPVLSRRADVKKLLKGDALKTFNDNLRASDIYNSVIEHKFHTKVQSDLTRDFSEYII